MAKDEVLIFYSSETEPEILDYYGEAISYLKELKKNVQVIDVFQKPALAEKHKIFATPTMLIKKGTKVDEHFGVLDGVKDLLRSDLFGETLIHGMSYKQGREFAVQRQLSRKSNKQIESILGETLNNLALANFKILKLDKKKNIAAVKFSCQETKGVASDVSPFIGGIFMEIFGKTVYADQQKNQRNSCELVVK